MADKNNILEKLDGLEARFEEVSTLITDPDVIADQGRYVKLTKEYKDLSDIMDARKRFVACINAISEAKDIIANESDPDMKEMAREELAENEELRNRKPATEQITVSTVSASPVVLFFPIGKATLDKKELTNLEFYVKHAIKADKNKTFTLIGSADKATGSKELNQRLSEQRMQYVYDLLVNKYGVSKDRLVKKAEGDTNNRFAEPELNRAVIVE